MYKIKINYDHSKIESLFIEKSLELIYKNTIDTYRLRLNNPKTAIQELMDVCSLMQKNELTNNQYAIALCKEVKNLLFTENELIFKSVSKSFYIKLFDRNEKNYQKILQASGLILNENKDYIDILYKKIYKFIIREKVIINADSKKLTDEETNQFLDLIQFLFVELLNFGYSKQYLHKYCTAIFWSEGKSFRERFARLIKLSKRRKENYEIIFGVEDNSFNLTDLKKINNQISIINSKDRKRIRIIGNKKVADFLDSHATIGAGGLFSIKLCALDYYKVVNNALALLSSDFDVYHLGHSDFEFKLLKDVVVIGENDPSKAGIIPSDYQIDGYYKSDGKVFKEFIKRLNKLNEIKISNESKRKIKSAIRYLRLGTESSQLENKLLYYWIGLEYIFTNHIDDSYTLERIKGYLPTCHALIYFKRNLNAFHKDIYKVNFAPHLANYNKDLKYLCEQKTYTTIFEKSNSELLKHRAKYYLTFLQQPEKITGILEKHQENLQNNITRLYRIRNEIVHNAAIKTGISTNAAHLRYYLTFILNSILEYFVNNPADIDSNGVLTIEDFFISQEIMLGSLTEKNKVKLSRFLETSNPNELLT